MEREIAYEGFIYLKVKDGETNFEAEVRLLDLLEAAGIEWGEHEMEIREV